MFSNKDFEVLKQVNRDLSGKTQLYKDSINDFDVSIFEVNGLKIFIFEEGNQKEHFSLYFTCNESELVINTIIDRFPAEICLRKEQLPCDSSIHTLVVAKERTIDIISDFVKSIVQQRELLDSSPEAMRTSSFVFPGPAGGQRKLHSYIRHFRRMRDLAGIPEDYRPNYCLRDTVASRLLSSGATLDEVAYQLGHSPGSPMTRRYARFLESAQRGIADRTQRVMDEMLN